MRLRRPRSSVALVSVLITLCDHAVCDLVCDMYQSKNRVLCIIVCKIVAYMLIKKLIKLTVHHLRPRYVLLMEKESNTRRLIEHLRPTASNMKVFGDYFINQCYSLLLLN